MPIVLFAKGENVNPQRKEEMGGFALRILISWNLPIWGGVGDTREGKGAEGRKERASEGLQCAQNTL